MTNCEPGDHGATGRRLIRSRPHAALATSLAGHPYVSLVATACGADASPLLLLSDLARHSENLAADPRLSLLFAAAEEGADPLAAARLTLLGRAERCDDPLAAARFAARHPESARYAGFADFRLYRVAIERGHLVAGFGRIAWIAGDELRFSGDAAELAAAEAGLVARINKNQAEDVALCAMRLLRQPGNRDWRVSGIDPEGIDLRRDGGGNNDGKSARLDFPEPVLTPAAARRMLAALAARARGAAPEP